MIRSMTGFGNGKIKTKYGALTVDIKTVNHKFLEITCKLPNSISLFEDKVKGVLQKDLKRGKAYLNLTYDGVTPHSESLYLDLGLARNYYNKLKELKRVLHIEGEIALNDIVTYPGVMNHRVSEKNISKLWPSVQKAVNMASLRLIKDREREGADLARDIQKRLVKMKKNLAKVKSKAHSNLKNYKKKLEQRIREISGIQPMNNDRLEMEVALFAKNSDITEELTRLSSHVTNVEAILVKGGEAGKKIDFVAQEMHREANTIGSKSSDYSISRAVIEVKSEIEKIREQIKNIE